MRDAADVHSEVVLGLIEGDRAARVTTDQGQS
jgi:hypothetical protein